MHMHVSESQQQIVFVYVVSFYCGRGRSGEIMEVQPREHHKQSDFCYTRPPYRQGKEFKAVKVYTINDESQHLLIHNVPSIGLLEEIKRLTGKFGKTEKVEHLKDYPVETEFTHAYYAKYKFLGNARQAKKRLDNRSFYGNILHVCYAPELESVEECKRKLYERQRFIQGQYSSKRKANSKPKGKATLEGETESNKLKAGVWSHLVPSSSTKVLPSHNKI